MKCSPTVAIGTPKKYNIHIYEPIFHVINFNLNLWKFQIYGKKPDSHLTHKKKYVICIESIYLCMFVVNFQPNISSTCVDRCRYINWLGEIRILFESDREADCSDVHFYQFLQTIHARPYEKHASYMQPLKSNVHSYVDPTSDDPPRSSSSHSTFLSKLEFRLM